MSERQPIKYQELMREKPKPRFSTYGLNEAESRLLQNKETVADREIIEGLAHHYGTNIFEKDKRPQSPSPTVGPITDMQPVDYYRLYARRYERLLVTTAQLQHEVFASRDGEVTKIVPSYYEGLEINQPVIDVFVRIGEHMRNTLYDGGYQSVVNHVHQDLGISFTEEGDMEINMTTIYERVERQER